MTNDEPMTNDEIDARLASQERSDPPGAADRAAYLALDAEASDPLTRIRIARGLIGIPEWSEAHRLLSSVADRWPELADAHYWLGFVLLHGLGRTGDVAESGRRFEEAARLRPDWPEPWYKLGLSHLWQGRPADAETVLRKALSLRPNWGKAHANLGLSLVEQERFAEALEHYRLGREAGAFEPALDRSREIK